MMFVLAEISDKIFLPIDGLVVGCFFGVLILIFGSLLSIYCRWWIVVGVFCAVLVMSRLWFLVIDPTLAEVAEGEIPGYHMRIRLGMGGPVMIGSVGAWIVGHVLQQRRARLAEDGQGVAP